MAKNKLSDLRDHLFETLEALKDEDKPMDLDRAKTVCEVAQAIINSAKIEVDLIKAVDGLHPLPGQFFGVVEQPRDLPKMPNGIRITRLAGEQ